MACLQPLLRPPPPPPPRCKREVVEPTARTSQTQCLRAERPLGAARRLCNLRVTALGQGLFLRESISPPARRRHAIQRNHLLVALLLQHSHDNERGGATLGATTEDAIGPCVWSAECRPEQRAETCSAKWRCTDCGSVNLQRAQNPPPNGFFSSVYYTFSESSAE